MPALKLFVSHSSRLDDVPNKWKRADGNWRLLDDTCKAIRDHYGDKVDVLVDKDGLTPATSGTTGSTCGWRNAMSRSSSSPSGPWSDPIGSPKRRRS